MVTRTSQNDSFIEALSSLTQADAAVDMIKERFIFAGFCMDHPPLEQLSNIINLGEASAALYLVVV